MQWFSTRKYGNHMCAFLLPCPFLEPAAAVEDGKFLNPMPAAELCHPQPCRAPQPCLWSLLPPHPAGLAASFM